MAVAIIMIILNLKCPAEFKPNIDLHWIYVVTCIRISYRNTYLKSLKLITPFHIAFYHICTYTWFSHLKNFLKVG